MKHFFVCAETQGKQMKSESEKNAHFMSKIERFMIFY